MNKKEKNTQEIREETENLLSNLDDESNFEKKIQFFEKANFKQRVENFIPEEKGNSSMSNKILPEDEASVKKSRKTGNLWPPQDDESHLDLILNKQSQVEMVLTSKKPDTEVEKKKTDISNVKEKYSLKESDNSNIIEQDDEFLIYEKLSKKTIAKKTAFNICKAIVLACIGFKDCFTTIFCCKSFSDQKLRLWMIKMRFKYWALFLMSVALVIAFAVFAVLETDQGSEEFLVTGNQYSFNINLKNCKLLLRETSEDKIKIYWYMSYFSFSRQLSEVYFERNQQNSNISMMSSKNDLRSCQLSLHIPNKLLLGNFQVNCSNECVMVSDSPFIKANDVLLTGERFYVNMRNLQVVQDLNFISDTGTFQLNEFSFGGTSSIDLSYGDVILQSSFPFNVDWKNYKHTFCFAGPSIINEKIENCSISGKDDTLGFINLTNCHGVTKLCSTSSCSNLPAIQINQLSGNTYANLLPRTGQDVIFNQELNIFKGSPYDGELSFEDHFEKEIISRMEENIKDKDPIFILDLGKKELQQSSYQKWTVVSNPSFAYMRPWWLSVFSVNLLTLKTMHLTGTLAPGLCPYHFSNTLEEYYKVERMLTKYFKLDRSEVSFVKALNVPYPGDQHSSSFSSGVLGFSTEKPISEEWLKVDVNPEMRYSLRSIDLKSQSFIIATLILSFLAAFFIGLTILKLFMIATIVSYKRIIFMSEHAEKYKTTSMEFRLKEEKGNEKDNEVVKEEKINIANLLKESSFLSFSKNVPRISSFVGFYSLILIKKFVLNSVEDFCNSLFREASEDEENNMKSGNEIYEQVEMSEFDLKNLYEKFCFLNHYPEQKLTDSLHLFESYGYTLVPDANSLAFSKIVDKKEVDLPTRDEILGKDPIDVYFKIFYNVSNIDLDCIFVDEFQKDFEYFCNYYNLEKVKFDHEQFALKYGLSITKKDKLKLVRQKERKKSPKEIYVRLFNIVLKILFCLVGRKYRTREETNFLIDMEVVLKQYEILESSPSKDLNEFLKNPSASDRDLELYAMRKMMFYPKWWAHELLFIVFHMVVTGVLMLPFIFLAILYEISYEPYSTINQEKLISMKDLMWSPWSLPHRLPVFIEWNITIISFTFLFALFNFVDDMFYFWYSTFPEDRTFLESQRSLSKSKFKKFLANMQWILVFFLILCYSSYVGLVLMWLLLGAIINPNNFLVYASASLTLLTFITTKYAAFKSLSDEGFKSVREVVTGYIQRQIRDITALLGKEMNKAMLAIKNDSTMKSISEFAVEKAASFGLENEIKYIKEMGENPEKLIDTIKETATEAILDPSSISEKLKVKRDEMLNKAKTIFVEKCKLNGIPGELAVIMVDLNFKQKREEVKVLLAEFIEKRTKEIEGLQLHIPKDLTKSLLNLVLFSSETEKNEESLEIMIQELVTLMINYCVKKIYKPSENEEPLEVSVSLIRKVIVLMEDMAKSNKKKIFKTVKDFIVDLKICRSNHLEFVIPILDMLDLMINQKSENRYKTAIVKILEYFKEPEGFSEFLALLIMCHPNEPILEFNGQRIENFDQVSMIFGKVLNYVKSLDEVLKDSWLFEVFEKVLAALYLMVKGRMNYDSTKRFCTSIFEIIIKNKPEFKEKYYFLKNDGDQLLEKAEKVRKSYFFKNAENMMNLLVAIINLVRDFRFEMKGTLEKYEISREIYLDVVCLMTNNAWKVYLNDRFENFPKSQFLKSMAGKVRMEHEELIGLIAMFTGNLEQEKYIEAFFVKSFERTKCAGPSEAEYAKEFILFLITPDSYQRMELSKKLNLSQIINEIKAYNIALDYYNLQAKEPANKDSDIFGIIIKDMNKNLSSKDIDKALISKKLNFYTYERTKELFKVLLDLITLSNYRDKPDIAGKTKGVCSIFAEIYEVDLSYLENLIFILLNEKSKKCSESVSSFLRDPKFDVSKEIADQIVTLINIQETSLDPENFIKLISDFIPDPLKGFGKFLSKIFFPQTKSGYDKSDESLIQDLMGVKMINEVSKIINFKNNLDINELLQVFGPTAKLEEDSANLIKRIFEGIFLNPEKNFKKFTSWVYDSLIGETKLFNNKDTFNIFMEFIALMRYRKGESWYNEKGFLMSLAESYGIPSDALCNLKLYFTTNADTFSQTFVKSFRDAHGLDSINRDTLFAVISLFTLTPRTQEISNILKIPPYVSESIVIFAQLLLLRTMKNSKLLITLTNSKTFQTWCSNLNIKKEELTLLLKLLYNSLTLSDFDNFFKTFGVGSIIDKSIFYGIFSLLDIKTPSPTPEESLTIYNTFKTHREGMLNLLGLSNIIGDFILHIQQGNFHYYYLHTLYVTEKAQKTYWVDKNKSLIQLTSFILGAIIGKNKSEINIASLLEEFMTKEQLDVPVFGLKRVAFYFFKNFCINPIFLIYAFDWEKEPRKQDGPQALKKYYKNFDTILTILSHESVTLDKLNNLVRTGISYAIQHDNESYARLKIQLRNVFFAYNNATKIEANQQSAENKARKLLGLIEKTAVKPYYILIPNFSEIERVIEETYKLSVINFIIFACIIKLRRIYQGRREVVKLIREEEEKGKQNENERENEKKELKERQERIVFDFACHLDFLVAIFEKLSILKNDLLKHFGKETKNNFVHWTLGAVFPEYFSRNELSKYEVIHWKSITDIHNPKYKKKTYASNLKNENEKECVPVFLPGGAEKLDGSAKQYSELQEFLQKSKNLPFWDSNHILPRVDETKTVEIDVFDAIYNKQPNMFHEKKETAAVLMNSLLDFYTNKKKNKEDFLTYESKLLGTLSKYMTSDLYNIGLILGAIFDDKMVNSDSKIPELLKFLKLPKKAFFSVLRPLLMTQINSNSDLEEKSFPKYLAPLNLSYKEIFSLQDPEDPTFADLKSFFSEKEEVKGSNTNHCEIDIQSLLKQNNFKDEELKTLNLFIGMFIGCKNAWKRSLVKFSKNPKKLENTTLLELIFELINNFNHANRSDFTTKALEEMVLSDFTFDCQKSLLVNYVKKFNNLSSGLFSRLGFSSENKPEDPSSKNDKRFIKLYELTEALIDRRLLKFIQLLSQREGLSLIKSLGKNPKSIILLNHIGALFMIMRGNPESNELLRFIGYITNPKKEKITIQVIGDSVYPLVKLLFAISLNKPEAILEYMGRYKEEENENENEEKKSKAIIFLTSIYFWFIMLRFPAEYSRDLDFNRKYASKVLCAFPMMIIELFDLSNLVERLNNPSYSPMIKSIIEAIQAIQKFGELTRDAMKDIRITLDKAFKFLHSYPEYLSGGCSEGRVKDLFKAIIEDLEAMKICRENIKKESAVNEMSQVGNPEQENAEDPDDDENFEESDEENSEEPVEENKLLEKRIISKVSTAWIDSCLNIFKAIRRITFPDVAMFFAQEFLKLDQIAGQKAGESALINFLINFFKLLNNFQANDDFEEGSDLVKSVADVFLPDSSNNNNYKYTELIETLISACSLRQLSACKSEEDVFNLISRILEKVADSFFDDEKSKKYVLAIFSGISYTLNPEKSEKIEELYMIILNFFIGKANSDSNIKIPINEIFHIGIQIKELFASHSQISKVEKRNKMFVICQNIGKILFDKSTGKSGLFSSLMSFIKGDIDKVGPELFILLNIPPSKQDFIRETLVALKEIIKGPQEFLNNKLGGLSKKIIGSDLQSLKEIMKRAGGNEEMSMEDLFNLVDTDHSGKINYHEFKTLSKRLGMTLSEHRIKEIFTSVKMETEENTQSSEINVKEFEVSMKYLQNKSVFLALETLGITKEVLTLILIWLTTMLVIIFAFIFVGVEAFAVTGTFGAIVNSIFPIAGGAVVSNKRSNHKEILTSDEFKSTVNKCIKIVQSMNI